MLNNLHHLSYTSSLAYSDECFISATKPRIFIVLKKVTLNLKDILEQR